MSAQISAQQIALGTMLPTKELAVAGRHDPTPLLALASRLEESGVDSLWVGESVLARPRIDAYTMLSAVAAVTSRSTIGAAVLLPALRQPVDFAHRVASLDQLSQGRLVVGCGAGFPGPGTEAEFSALDADYRRRVSGLQSTLQAARAHWRAASSVSSESGPGGRGRPADAVAFTPPPTRPAGPPTWLATATPSGLRDCGRCHDGWLPYPPNPGDYASGLAQIRAVAVEAGRDPETITPGLYVTVAIGRDAQRQLDDYALAYYGAPSEMVGAIQAMVAGDIEYVTERLMDYVEAGARHLVIRHATLEPSEVAMRASELHASIRSALGARQRAKR